MSYVTRSGTGQSVEASARPRFFFVLSLVLLFVVFLGFAPTFYLDPLFDTRTDYRPTPVYIKIHAIILTMWFVGQVVQSGLIQRGRRNVHRTIGVIGAGIAAGVIITGVVATLIAVPHAEEFGISPRARLNVLVAANSFNLLVFAALVSLALHYRSRPQYHKRLMLIASIAIIGPAVSPFRQLGIFLQSLLPESISIPVPLMFWVLLIVSIALYDLLSDRRIHPATIWGGCAKAAATVMTISLVKSGYAGSYVNWLESWL